MTGKSLDSAVFVGTARNCARWLPDVLANLAKLSRLYDRAAFIFAVSDSTDATTSLLRQWLGAGWTGKVIDLGELAGRIELRTERIAFARNTCLDEARGSTFKDYGHMVVADMDDVLAAPIDLDSYRRAAQWLDTSPDRAAAFSSASPCYYDIWALRHPTWSPHDCWHRIWGRPRRESFERAKFREVFARQIELPRKMKPIEVRSAFGGLGLYRMSYAVGARYVGADAQGREVSEHVAFNETIGRAGGRLFVFPDLQVRAPPEHLYDPGEFGLRWRVEMRLRKALERYRPTWRRL